jgi:DNA polymerase-3 subunit delta
MIIFLYGEDTFRSRQKLTELKEKFKREVDPQGNSLVCLEGETVSLEEINEAVAAPSLFTKRRMIVIDKIYSAKSKKVRDAVLDYFKKKKKVGKDKDKDNIVIFWDEIAHEEKKKDELFKFLSKQEYVQEFKPLSNTESTNWIKATVKERDGAIRGQAAVHLSSLFGSDLWQINHEINKLISYKRGQKPELVEGAQVAQIEVSDVDELCRGTSDENIFALTDAISNRNKAQALKLFEQELNSGVTESYLLYMITRQFKIMLQVREALDEGLTPRKITNKLKLHPFVVQKSISQVRKFNQVGLKAFFKKLVDVDRLLKSGQADFRSALSLLIAAI